MKVIVLGAGGMLGQATAAAWSDHDVVAFGRQQVDITNRSRLAAVLDRLHPNLVINCAADTDVDRCEQAEAAATLVNGTAVGWLAAETSRRNIPIIHYSTDYVFSGQQAEGYRESDVPDQPVNAYGRTKLAGERLLTAATGAYYLIRTSWLFGPGGKNFPHTILGQAQTQPKLTVIRDQHGKPTYAPDLAVFTKNLILDHAPFGVYHAVNEEPTTWFDFARAVVRGAGLSTPVEPCPTSAYPRPARRPTWSILLNTKRSPLRPWSGALRDYLAVLRYPQEQERL